MTKEELIQRWEKNFGIEETKKLLLMPKRISKDTYIRINISKTTPEKIAKFLKTHRVRYSKTFLPNSFKIEKSFFNLTSSIPALTGDIYFQDIASQIPINCIDFKQITSNHKSSSTLRILDLCASPGSKTTQLADLLNYHKINYEIIAIEPEEKRLTRLINNIQKQSFKNLKIINKKGQDYETEKLFDLILLDAPCSGNLVGDRGWLNKRDVKGILERAKIQKELLKKATSILKHNGLLIYSTCSLEKEENEDNVEYAKFELKLKDIKPNIEFAFSTKPLIKSQNSMRFMPHISNTQGFFVCCFKK